MLKIRLARGGMKKLPHYRIIVADARSPRDGRFVEKIGHYHPLMKDDNKDRVVVKHDRLQYWLKNGAKPTERIIFFMKKYWNVDYSS